MVAKEDANEVRAESPGIDCPICHKEVHHSIKDHLLEAHTREDLASFVTKYVLERELDPLV